MKLIRERPDWVKERLRRRGAGDESRIDPLLGLDEQRRHYLGEVEQLKALRNRVSKEIGGLLAQKKVSEAEAKKAETRQIGRRISELDQSVEKVEQERNVILMGLPNLPDDTVPVGETASDNPVIREWGKKVPSEECPKKHVELAENLGLVDFARGTKLAGSGFLVYRGWGARLERALIQFMLDLHTGTHGYLEISPPFLVGRDCMYGVGQFPKFIDQAYAVQEGIDASTLGKLYLIPTAEAPIVNLHREEILDGDRLPIYYCAYSPCFRAEAGAAGVGTRGMIRVHQFDKVELIRIVSSERSEAELERLVADAEAVLQRLELHYRVVLLNTKDLGFSSTKTYDIEVWAPAQGQYLEVSSCSNCQDFQARRMNLRYKVAGGANRFPHILNGSGTALARLFVALLETHQQPDGSIRVPPALQPYLGTERLSTSMNTRKNAPLAAASATEAG